MTLVRFLHLVGIGLWLGGGATALIIVTTQATEPPHVRAAADRLIGRTYAWVIAPGAILAIASGFAITMMVASQGFGARLGHPAVAAMQATGLLAGILEIMVSFPASQRLGRMASAEDGAPPAVVARTRARVKGVTSAALALLVVAFYLGMIQ